MKKKTSARSVSTRHAKARVKEFALLALIVFLSFATALAVFFLDVTKDLRQRAADDVASFCNRSCEQNWDCLSNMVCWPYNRSSDQKGVCRLDSNPNNDKCQQRQGVGFIVQVYNDLNGNGFRDNDEQGVAWKFKWDRNKDEQWRDYDTYAERNGEGGRVGDLNAGDVIRVRIQGQGGWEVTTPTEMQAIMADETTRVAYFGVRRPVASPTPKPTPTPTSVTKGGLGGADTVSSPTPAVRVLTSPSPSPTMSPSPTPTPAPVQQVGFLGWLRQIFRNFYCWITKSCPAE